MKAVLLLFLMASACGVAKSNPDTSGTYELIVCKNACSFENPKTVIARGVVILFENSLSRTDVEKLDPFHFREPNEGIRACFAGESSKGAESLAFGRKTGVTVWSLNDKTLSFFLFRSVDAGYSVDVQYSGNAFSGKGVSWGAGVAAPGYTPDIVVGRRVGPPDIAACTKGTTRPAT